MASLAGDVAPLPEQTRTAEILSSAETGGTLAREGLQEQEEIDDEASPPSISIPHPTRTPLFPTLIQLLKEGQGTADNAMTPNDQEIVKKSSLQCAAFAEESLARGKGVVCVALDNDEVLVGSGMRFERSGTVMRGTFNGRVNSVVGAEVRRHGVEEPVFRGRVENGDFDGECEVSMAEEGVRFTGHFHQGQASGLGVLFRGDGSWYEGDWQLGKRHGFGAEHFSADEGGEGTMVYRGNWRCDVYHGAGEFDGAGYRLKGEWRNGVRHGVGELRQVCTEERKFQIVYDDEGNESHRMAWEEAEIETLRGKVTELEQQLATARAAEEAQGRRPPRRGANNDPASSPSPAAATPTQQQHDRSLCKVCLANPINRVLRPCNHACLCNECVARIREEHVFSRRPSEGRVKCPVCRTMCVRVDDVILS